MTKVRIKNNLAIILSILWLAWGQDRVAAAVLPKPASGVFFVALDGNDQWSGLRPTPTWTKTDGPFATLPRALQAARQWRQQPGRAGAKPAIYVRGGLHFLTAPLVLNPEDSGLVLAAYGEEQSVLSAGRRITGWKPVAEGNRTLWQTEIPEVRAGTWYFRELWINGQRAVRARHPNHGYLKVDHLLDTVPDWLHGHMRLRFFTNDLKNWKTVTQAEVVVMDRWVESRLPVFSVDELDRIASFEKRSVFQLGPGDLYYLEGAFEALDEPGEWFLDRYSGTLSYLPRPGEKLKQFEAVAPRLEQVVRLEGRPEAAQWVERVCFRGLTFAHNEWYFSEIAGGPTNMVPKDESQVEIGGFGQSAVGVPGAVWGVGVRACTFENCRFSHLGTYALELARGCQTNRMLNCEFVDLGAGAVKLGETVIRNQAAEQCRANEISDCHLHDGGKLFHSAAGIWVGQSSDNLITHNLIHDFYQIGISLGWTWGYGPALATNNTVSFNHVHHIGIKSNGDGPIFSDLGGIYTLGLQSGTKVYNNFWHDIAGLRYGGWGIYFDEGTCGILAESNVVCRTTHGGFEHHYGATNIVRNNIFAFGRDQQLQRTRLESHLSFTFATNIIYFDSGTLLAGQWADDHYQLDWNLYFDARPAARAGDLRFLEATPEQWRARGHDLHSLIADPLFVAPQQNDFRLQSNSPALKLGFQPIDLDAVGIRNRGNKL